MFRQRVEDMTKAVRGNVVGLIVSSIVAPAAALDKSVAAGETWRVTAAESVLELDRLTLGDGARIEFAEDVERWSLNARQVRIGRDVVIDGRGEAGNAGAPGAGYAAAAPDCNDGKAGKPGGAGGEGSSGVDLSLNLGIAAIGSLSVVTDGGAGGAGGVGGAGQHGGDIRKCRGGAGGTGGEGGRGGDGGDAGELTLVYRPLSGLDTSSVLRAIQLSSEGGEGGAGGVGGVGGDAVEGRYMKGSFAGNKKWLAGGKPGARGAAGDVGAAGSSRNPVLQVDGATAKSLRPPPVDDRVKRNSRIAELERRVEALEKRLRALEQDAQR